jgi:hypothetical protein
MTKFTKTFFVGVSVAMLSVVLLWAQTRIQRPVNPQTGYSAGVSYSSGGNVATQLFNGEVMILTDQGTDAGPLFRMYDGINLAWQHVAAEFGAGDTTITFEGATADAFEIILSVEDATVGDSNYRLMDNAFADIYPVMFSNFATNSWDTANSVWGTINGLHFEGATANDWELSLSSDDPLLRDQFFDLPNNDAGGAAQSYNLMFSVLDTNALDVASSIWFEANDIWFEGTTANAFEIVLTAEDSTVGVDSYLFMDHGLAADNYYVTAVPDISRTTGSLYYGEYTDAVAAAGEADDVMIVQRIFIPHVVTVTHVDLLNIDIANVSAGDNTISVAIYNDADAGAQIVETVGATDDGAGNATGLYTIDIADTVLHPGWYRIGFCAQDASDNDIEVHTVNADVLLVWAGGALASEYTSTAAANPCVAGNPNALTGVLTQSVHKVPFKLRTQ